MHFEVAVTFIYYHHYDKISVKMATLLVYP